MFFYFHFDEYIFFRFRSFRLCFELMRILLHNSLLFHVYLKTFIISREVSMIDFSFDELLRHLIWKKTFQMSFEISVERRTISFLFSI